MRQVVIMIFYAVLILVLAALGFKFTSKVIQVTSTMGGILGAVLGVFLSILLWFTVGKKLVSNEDTKLEARV